MQKVPFWGRDETAPHLEGQYGAREKTSVVFVLSRSLKILFCSFEIVFRSLEMLCRGNEIVISCERTISREQNNYFVGTT